MRLPQQTLETKKVPHILILGSGYVTITAARGLQKAIRRKEVEVTVISRENFHCFHGFVGEMITGRVSPGSIVSPVRRIIGAAYLYVANIEHIDMEAQQITVSRLNDGSRTDLRYDHLLIALGSADNLEIYPGLKEHGFCLKTYEECFRVKNHILKMFEQAGTTNDPEERKALLTFVIAGGGYAGTEIAGEMSDFARLLTSKEYPHIRREECRVILVCKTATILPELRSGKGAAGYGNGHPTLVNYASGHSLKLGVEVKLDTSVTLATAGTVQLSNGEVISTRTIINAVGTKAQAVIECLNLEKDPKGRIVVNKDMTVKGWSNVWAGGDCAALPHPKGDYCPSVGIFALKGGAHFAKNVLRKIRSKPLKEFSYVGIGQGVSIGRRTAVVELSGVRIRGLLAWILWRVLLVYYFPTWDRRLRLLADWIIWPFVGRDIVQLTAGNEDNRELKTYRFEAGQEILEAIRNTRFEHLLVQGKVEVVSAGIVAHTFAEGDYLLLDAGLPESTSLRAKGEVRTLAVKKEFLPLLHKQSMKKNLRKVGAVSELQG